MIRFARLVIKITFALAEKGFRFSTWRCTISIQKYYVPEYCFFFVYKNLNATVNVFQGFIGYPFTAVNCNTWCGYSYFYSSTEAITLTIHSNSKTAGGVVIIVIQNKFKSTPSDYRQANLCKQAIESLSTKICLNNGIYRRERRDRVGFTSVTLESTRVNAAVITYTNSATIQS